MKTYTVNFNVQVSGEVKVTAESFEQAAANVRGKAKDNFSGLLKKDANLSDWNDILVSSVMLDEAGMPEGVGCVGKS